MDELVVPVKLGRVRIHPFAVERLVYVAVLFRLVVGLGPLTLLLHRGIKGRHIHIQPGLARHFHRQVNRETVGVVQLECLGARENLGARGGDGRGRLVETRRTRLERL